MRKWIYFLIVLAVFAGVDTYKSKQGEDIYMQIIPIGNNEFEINFSGADEGDLQADDEQVSDEELQASESEVAENESQISENSQEIPCLKNDEFCSQSILKLIQNRQKDEAKELAANACEKDIAVACRWMGYLSLSAFGEKQNWQIPLEFYNKGCDLEDSQSCLLAGKVSQAMQDTKGALMYFKKSCDMNNFNACMQAAAFYEYATAGTVNYKEAEKYYQKLCENDYPRACYKMGEINYYALSKEQDLAKAWKFYQKACEYNDANACSMQALMSEKGLAGEKDLQNAYILYAKACELGLDNSCMQSKRVLGILHEF